jgi:haloalkane dehalogenase
MINLEAIREIYPFYSNYITFNYGKHRYHYLDEGPRTRGKAVVMLHGNPTWSFYFRNVVLALRDKYRCVVPDHMGCGLSDKPQDYSYTLKQHILNAEDLLNRLELDDVTLIVHDWGGAIGMGVAARNPQRVKKLVVMNTAAFTSSLIPMRLELCRLPIFGDIAIRGFNAFALGALRMAIAHRDRITPQIRAGYVAPYNNWQNRVALLRFVQDIPMHPSHPTWPVLKSIEDGLEQFKNRPMLLCWGLKDFVFTEAFLKEWEKRFPQAEALRFADAGHYVLEDAHERITPKILEFLAK